MKIVKIEPILVKLPYEHGGPKPPLGMGEIRATMDALFVRVETDDGLVGWGEAFGFATVPVTIPAIRDVIAPHAVGRDPLDLAGLHVELQRRFQNMMRGGPARFALSALDIALWDIAGQVKGQPIWQMLGGAQRTRVPAYASLLRLPTPKLTAHVAAAAAERGYRHVKLHQKTVESVAAARQALGSDISLMLDVNCAWAPHEATSIVRQLRDYDLEWLEEPLFPPDDFEALAHLRKEGVPLAIGENLGNPNDVRWLTMLGAVDVVQPSVAKIGGISDVWRIATFAAANGVRVVPHSPFVGPGLVATIHLVAAMPSEVWCEHRYCDLAVNPLGDAILAREGYLSVPQGPGLGIAVDEDLIARYRAG